MSDNDNLMSPSLNTFNYFFKENLKFVCFMKKTQFGENEKYIFLLCSGIIGYIIIESLMFS